MDPACKKLYNVEQVYDVQTVKSYFPDIMVVPPELEGKTVLDLGSGSGRDCFILSKLVGPNAYKPNVVFKKDILKIGIDDESIDVVVSNGVIDISTNKRNVYSEIFRVLKSGECLSGALYIEDFRRLITSLGYPDYRTIIINRKVPLEDRSEDYGQVAVYKGNIEDIFVLDNHHVFKINDQIPICGNTSAMLQKTRYADYFDITGESVHYGLFKSSE
ncbi:hypothetical protein C1646_767958 [Rhizophagus diaphanus]|nr:hypothetical protein C1646_767958 [Rhizophagus diaphanus] [Rhizophagus sp. MUCL 43196]